MFSFERLITPKVINGLYIITVVALIAVAIIFLFYRSIYIARQAANLMWTKTND